MHAYMGEMVKITKTAKGFHMLPGTRLADLVERKEFLQGQVVHWKASTLEGEDIALSHEIVFVSATP